MLRWLPWALGLGALLMAVGASAGVPDPARPGGSGSGSKYLRQVVEASGAPAGWATFLDAVAATETGRTWDPSAVNTSPSEASAACYAYNRALSQGRLRTSPWGRAAYCFGSGGWFGLIPANAVYAFNGTGYENMDPAAVFDPVASVVMALDYARRTMRRESFQADPTWLTLRAGFGRPAAMDDPKFRAQVATRFARALEAIGVSPSFMHQRVTPMTGYPGAVSLFERMGGRA